MLMKMLVKFIAVGCKKSIANNESYTMEIYKSINLAMMIKSLNLTPDEVTFGVGPLRSLDDEDNVFLLQFNSEDNGKADIWSIYFQYGTFNDSKQLEIAIYSDTYLPDVDNEYLEKLKLMIKKSIRRDWDKIIWLVDKDSECLSIALYPQVYKIENLMREINSYVERLFPEMDFEEARSDIGRVRIETVEDAQNQIVCMINLCAG